MNKNEIMDLHTHNYFPYLHNLEKTIIIGLIGTTKQIQSSYLDRFDLNVSAHEIDYVKML